jgi:hypothetical protein
MIAKTIEYNELEKAIRVSFKDDKDILTLYDPLVKTETVEDIVSDIVKKIKTHGKVIIKGVYEKNKLIGFFIRAGGLLVSFGIAVEYRVRRFKNKLWQLIREEFKGIFKCYLWTTNQRAIKFLQKCGMIVTNSDERLTELTCP